ncbi:NAD(P)/FAD-dependent oxidoreductase [Congregibacter brevis]|uniref:NAD(P)/FAD-dependent oxidoreductase n=1 Tax=Congregibacter brevis TaxID=3081201 RepID=A0ABZ0IEC5_9GAMM|nr:NAD(P)/FAD-dependent oxidoreductase [Congregibacter sp. IMCC45268]
MSQKVIEADYLVIGSGAVGMAFSDILLTESDATIVIVDRYAKPGGHWNAAYPFVQLHQPSQFYGVTSRELSRGRLEQGGLNDGLNELASGAEVSAYFDDVMRHQFLPSGRVQYFPMCDYTGNGQFVSKVGGQEYHVNVKKKIVDATFLKTKVPSTHTPNFSIDEGVRFMPLNDLPKVTDQPDRYVVVGGGKTGIDACLWLLQMGCDPDKIQWIRPRDAWLLNRRNTQPTDEFFFDVFNAQAGMMESAANADSFEDLFDKLENCGYFLRIDPNQRPEMFHGATISAAELDALRTIKDVVRLGRITHLGRDQIDFQKGSLPVAENTLFVDCSARPIDDLPDDVPVFAENVITPQMVRSYQPVFSAALAAHVELNYEGDDEKNRLCAVVPPPEADTDFAHFTAIALTNQYNWSQDSDLSKWILKNRLDGFSQMARGADGNDEKMALLNRMRSNGVAAVMNLMKLDQEYKQQEA